MLYLKESEIKALIYPSESTFFTNGRIFLYMCFRILFPFTPRIMTEVEKEKKLKKKKKYWGNSIPNFLRPLSSPFEALYQLPLILHTWRTEINNLHWFPKYLALGFLSALACGAFVSHVSAKFLWHWLLFPISYPVFLVRNWNKLSTDQIVKGACLYFLLVGLALLALTILFPPAGAAVVGVLINLPHLIFAFHSAVAGLSLLAKDGAYCLAIASYTVAASVVFGFVRSIFKGIKCCFAKDDSDSCSNDLVAGIDDNKTNHQSYKKKRDSCNKDEFKINKESNKETPPSKEEESTSSIRRRLSENNHPDLDVESVLSNDGSSVLTNGKEPIKQGDNCHWTDDGRITFHVSNQRSQSNHGQVSSILDTLSCI